MSRDTVHNTRPQNPGALVVSLQCLHIGEVCAAHHGLVEPAVCSFGAPKRKAPASGGHGGERHDSARMAAKLIILSRLLQQKNEEALRAASVTQHGTAFLHEMERIYLAACLPLLDTATTLHVRISPGLTLYRAKPDGRPAKPTNLRTGVQCNPVS